MSTSLPGILESPESPGDCTLRAGGSARAGPSGSACLALRPRTRHVAGRKRIAQPFEQALGPRQTLLERGETAIDSADVGAKRTAGIAMGGGTVGNP